ncbi:MAG: hypothetical protein HY741_23355 [Chloroflexi bacterium]|nr:hypothetical protein [Chloroflexota bacterium]
MEVNGAAAYANALYNALGIHFTELPIMAEKIVRAVREKEMREMREMREGMQVMQAAE